MKLADPLIVAVLRGSDFKNSAETRKFLGGEEALLREILTELGVIQR